MQPEENFGFKFQIGEVLVPVYFELQEHGMEKFVVIERVLQQCYGGIQRHYKCRPFVNCKWQTATAEKFTTFTEPELKLWVGKENE